MAIKDFVNYISRKYNYPNTLKNKLIKILPGLLLVYSDKKNTIFEALMNTKIITSDNNYDEIKKLTEFSLEINEETLINSEGVYFNIPKIKYNKTYKILKTDHYISVRSDINEDTLTHELGHLIKSYKNPNEIKGDILTEYSGIATSVYKLSYENDIVNKTLISSKNIGIEEALNTYDTYLVMSKIYPDAKKDYSYFHLVNVGEYIKNNIILDNEFLNSNTFKEISLLADKITEVIYLQTEGNKTTGYFNNLQVINPLYDEIMNKLRNIQKSI